MLEALEYILGSFWRFIGFTIIVYIVLFFVVNGIVNLLKALK